MPASDYNPNIPQPTDSPSASQPALLLNFGAITDLIDVDHVDFAAAGAGKHNKITFPVQFPAPTFTFPDLGLYSLLSPVTDNNELYVSTYSGSQVPMTASILSTNAAPGNNTPGWSYFPSGIIEKWGNATGTGAITVTFPVSGLIPVFTGVQSVLLTTMGSATDVFVQLTSFTATGFVAYCSARSTTAAAAVTFQYRAIGY